MFYKDLALYIKVCGEGRGAIVVVVSGSPGSTRPVGGEAKKSPQQLSIMSQI